MLEFLPRGEGGMVDPGQQELLDEMLSFQLRKHDDLLDAAAVLDAAYLLDTREPHVWYPCDSASVEEKPHVWGTGRFYAP